ncbi:MAG: NADP-dependent malic enzyme, partial [Bacteroidetes bacterium]|nr:NADP-dependent malic enzyme [Bacteroidota bacterium]
RRLRQARRHQRDSGGRQRAWRSRKRRKELIMPKGHTIGRIAEIVGGKVRGDADVFIGVSKGNLLESSDIGTMADAPIILAMANPIPEIMPDEAIRGGAAVVGTGRSDFPNQVNNVLGFPFIFRGALDVRATEINEEMKLAAVRSLTALAKEPVPDIVNMAYSESNIIFGKDYIIPKPVDPRLITSVAAAVAKAAMESGVARKHITDWDEYNLELRKRLGIDDNIIHIMVNKAKTNPKRVVFAEADNVKILKAAQIIRDEGIAYPILLGKVNRIKEIIEENSLELGEAPIIDTRSDDAEEKREQFGEILFDKRKRRGFNLYEAKKIMRDRNYYGAMMVETGEADALISGLTRNYPDTIKPALQTIGTAEDVRKVCGMYIMLNKKGPFFFADTTVNVDPTTKELVDITVLTAQAVKQYNIQPRISLLSYSNFGSSEGEPTIKVRKAVEILKEKFPGMIVDGEMQANFALNADLLKDNYPFSDLVNGSANTLIFPNLSSGNIAYKLLQELGNAEAVGPILLGLKKPMHILQLGSSIREIVNMVTIAVVDAQSKQIIQ